MISLSVFHVFLNGSPIVVEPKPLLAVRFFVRFLAEHSEREHAAELR